MNVKRTESRVTEKMEENRRERRSRQGRVVEERGRHDTSRRENTEVEEDMKWRRVSLNEKNQLEMVDSSFKDELNKVGRYG